MGSYNRIRDLLYLLNQEANRANHEIDTETEGADMDAAEMELGGMELAQLEEFVRTAEALLRKFEQMRLKHLEARRARLASRSERQIDIKPLSPTPSSRPADFSRNALKKSDALKENVKPKEEPNDTPEAKKEDSKGANLFVNYHSADRAPAESFLHGCSKDPPPKLQRREYIILTLEALDVPVMPTMVSSFARKRWGIDIPTTTFSSTRKGDERAWDRGRRTRVILVPALNALDLSARTRTVALSSWPLEKRVIGGYTERANALRLFLRAHEWLQVASREDTVSRTEDEHAAWLWIITALGRDFKLPLQKPDQAVEEARAKLAQIDVDDLAERKAAADRAAKLAERWQLFGRPHSL